MKLLIYCYEYPPIGGGAGNALGFLARIWAGQGHAVTIVTSQFGDLPADAVTDGVRVLRLAVGRRSVSRGRLVEMIRFMAASRRTADAVYEKTRPDLAVAFFTIPSGTAPMYLKRRHGLPFVTELRGGDVPGFSPKLLGFFHLLLAPRIRSIWKASSLVIANSRGLADLARKTAPELRIEVTPNGVDTRVFQPAAPLPSSSAPTSTDRPAGSCRCVFVGRIVDGQKQISRLIQAIADQPGIELAVVGAGPDEARLKRLAAAGAGAGRIHFKGWAKGPELLRILQASDVYVSASAWEGMSNSALEGLSCGLPLVLSRISGHEELVEEGKNGFLFDVGSTEELKAALRRIASDPGLRLRFAEASRERAEKHFDWQTLAAQHLDLYRQALST